MANIRTVLIHKATYESPHKQRKAVLGTEVKTYSQLKQLAGDKANTAPSIWSSLMIRPAAVPGCEHVGKPSGSARTLPSSDESPRSPQALEPTNTQQPTDPAPRPPTSEQVPGLPPTAKPIKGYPSHQERRLWLWAMAKLP